MVKQHALKLLEQISDIEDTVKIIHSQSQKPLGHYDEELIIELINEVLNQRFSWPN